MMITGFHLLETLDSCVCKQKISPGINIIQNGLTEEELKSELQTLQMEFHKSHQLFSLPLFSSRYFQ